MTAPQRRTHLIRQLEELGAGEPRVLAVMGRIPRERFLPAAMAEHAYDNAALPIGHGQTISQPEVVARMTSALHLTDRHKVLEIGTGSGYQTAILAKLARRIYTIERHRPLLKEAEERLAALRIHNVTTWHGDGSSGWPDQAPFDRIIVTAAAGENVPGPLIDQLVDGGILVIPVARGPSDQLLVSVSKRGDELDVIDLGAVRFVPLVPDEAATTDLRPISNALARLRRPR